MKLLIFRTNIQTPQKVARIQTVMENMGPVRRCTVDTEDVDNVLRIEAMEDLDETQVMNAVRSEGFLCDALPD